MKLFGREPAFWVGLVEAVLALLLAWNALGLNPEQSAAILAVVTAAFGFFTAYRTRQTLLAIGVGLAKSILILFTAFGLEFSENQTAALMALIAFVLGAYNRDQADAKEVNERGDFDLAT